MKLTKNMSQVELKKSKEDVTARMGLSFVEHCLRHYGLAEMVKKIFSDERGSNREIEAYRKIMGGAMTRIAGGERIEDIEVIRKDEGLKNSLGWESIISPDTLIEFIKDKEGGDKSEKVNEAMVIKAIKECEEGEFTYDNDATYFDSDKRSTNYSYQGEKQFSGLLGFIAEIGICNTVSFRRGNVSPQEGIYEQLEEAIQQVKEAGKRIRRFRSDSAGQQNKIFQLCNKERVEYYISLDKNEAVKVCIRGIKEKEWKPLTGRYQDQLAKEWAETVYVTEKGISMRMLVMRWANPDPRLFDESPFCHHAISTNNNEIEGMEWLEVHNGRMNSENYNKEIKGGFGNDYAPSHEFEINRGYFLIGVLAYNMLQIMKLFYLGKEHLSWTIKTIRFRFINVCGKIILTGRKYICKIINVTDEIFELFRNCKSRLIIVG